MLGFDAEQRLLEYAPQAFRRNPSDDGSQCRARSMHHPNEPIVHRSALETGAVGR